MKPKHVMSAMINTKNPDSWRIPFEAYPTLMQLLDGILTMRPAVLKHPLCVPLASAHLATGTSIPRTISICLGHLDDASLSAAAGELSSQNMPRSSVDSPRMRALMPPYINLTFRVDIRC